MGRSCRRTFLKQTAALGATVGLPSLGVPMILRDRAPNEKLGIAVIGCVGILLNV